MPSLGVGPITIPVSAPGISRPRLDSVDRARAFDGTYRASATGTAKRDFFFSTIPLPRVTADIYELTLSLVTAQVCFGDVIGGGNNSLKWSEDFANAIWVKTTMTIGATVADPIGGTSANTLTATGANANVRQTLAGGSSIVRTNSVWLKRRTGTGTVQVLDPPAANWVTVALTTAWQRFSVTGAAATPRDSGILIATSGDAVDAFGFQQDDAALATSYIKTTTDPIDRTTVNCCSEITGWKPIQTGSGHRVVLEFVLHEQ